MHIILKNQISGEVEGIICVDRTSQSAIVLEGDIEQLDTLCTIAFGMKVPAVRLVVPVAAVEELEALGWVRSPELIVLSKVKR